MDQTEDKGKIIDDLCASMRTAFDSAKLSPLGRADDIERIQKIVKERVVILQPGRDSVEIARKLTSELSWSLMDVQVAIGHVLFCNGTGRLHPGGTDVQISDIEIPQYQTADVFFGFYASMSAETIYRVWARLENLLLFMVFGAHDPRAHYLPKIIERIKSEKQELANTPEFKELEKIASWRDEVAADRNTDSHGKSSLFSEFHYEVQYSDVLQASGKPFFRFILSTPAPHETVNGLLDRYKRISEWIMAVIRVIDAAARIYDKKKE